MIRAIALLSAATLAISGAEPLDTVRKEIEAAYAKALDAMLHAKTMADLDEMNRSFDTLDWRSISPGQQPRSWEELRRYGFEGLWAPFQSLQFIVDSFELNDDTAVLKGRLRAVNMKGEVGFVPLKETFRKTVMGWKRQIHQKFRPGETPN